MTKHVYWTAWGAQVVMILGLGFYFLGGVYEKTFQSALQDIGYAPLFFLVLISLLPFWLIQLYVTPFVIQMSIQKALAVWIGTYVFGLGPIAVIAMATIDQRASTPSVLRFIKIFFLTLVGVASLSLLIQIYAIIVVHLFLQIMTRAGLIQWG